MRTAFTLSTLALLLSAPVADAAQPAATAEATVRRLVEALKDSDPDVRQNIAVALAKAAPASVEPLTDALKDPIPDRRAGAAYALGLIGPGARAALPALLDALKDDDVAVRRQVSFAISRIIPPGRPVVADARRDTAGPTNGVGR